MEYINDRDADIPALDAILGDDEGAELAHKTESGREVLESKAL
jgi:hypothetical protein